MIWRSQYNVYMDVVVCILSMAMWEYKDVSHSMCKVVGGFRFMTLLAWFHRPWMSMFARSDRFYMDSGHTSTLLLSISTFCGAC